MRNLKRIERRSCGCCLGAVLLFILAVAGLTLLIVKAAGAASQAPPVYEVVLLSDQSTSMWDCDGIGTDPELLRVDAARLFIASLGTDSSARYRLALFHFGGEAAPVAGLTDLADEAARQRLMEVASHPQPMHWTDHLRALQAGQQLLAETGTPGSRRLIVLLTDGEPAPNPANYPTAYDTAGYIAALRDAVADLARSDVTLAIVLLSDIRTSCGRRVATEWAGHWATLAEMTPGGALYVANLADDLLPIYHAIVRHMLGLAEGAVPLLAVLTPGTPLTVDVPVQEPLASLILTIWKHNPATTVEVRDPTGNRVLPGQAEVTITGGGAGGREEVWRINRPQIGLWRAILSGQGRVSVWQDRLPLPTPTVTPTASPTATSTATPTPTVTPTASPTATPTASATPAPTETATATASPSPPTAPAAPQGGTHSPTRPAWPVLAGAGIVGLSALGLLAGRRRGPHLTGQLVPVTTPAGGSLLAPRDLALERRRRIYLGKRGRGEWRLPGWEGTLELWATSLRTVTVNVVEGEATLNGQPLRRPLPLADGAVIGCGEYRIRYENLLE